MAAAVGGGFSVGDAAGRFLLEAAGGLVTGGVVAWLVLLSRRAFGDPLPVNAISLATPFAAFAAGSAARASGVLAVVVAGLIIGHQAPRLKTGATRLQAGAVWDLVNFLLEGFVFLLIGQQLPVVVRGMAAYGTGTVATAAAVTVGAVLMLRPAWLVLTQHVPRWLHARLGSEDDDRADREKPLSVRAITVLSWAGTRGGITLAAAFAIPVSTTAGHGFPARDLLLFLAYLVVLVTLLGQGWTLGPLLRRLALAADPVDQARLRNEARTAAVEAALGRLDQMASEEELPERVVRDMRQSLTMRLDRYRRRLEFLKDKPEMLRPAGYQAAIRARRALIDTQHEELLRWRDAGRLPDTSLRVLQQELDHEERTLPVPPS